MNKIYYKQIKIHDFKGVKNKTVLLSDTRNIVKGANGIGKTSIAEAITFTLFGKGLNGERINNEPIINGEIDDKYQQTLELTIVVNDKEYILSKKLVKNTLVEMSINKKPITKVREWNDEVQNILGIGIEEFEILSNPKYLNGITNNKAREYILSLVSNVNDKDILNDYITPNGGLESEKMLIMANLDNDISINKQLSMQRDVIKALKEEIKGLNYKVDSKKETLEKISGVDVKDYNNLIAKRTAIKTAITKNDTYNDKISEQLLEKQKLEIELNNITVDKLHVPFDVKIESKEMELAQIRNDFDINNAKPLEEFAKECYVCNRPIDAKESLESFKEGILNDLESKGKKLNEEIKNLLSEQSKWNEQQRQKFNDIEIIKKKISALSFDAKKRDNFELRKELDEVVNAIGSYESINIVKNEINDIETIKNEKDIILDKEITKEKLLSELFSNKVKAITEKINKKLKNVSVELFEVKKNGNIKEVFTISSDGITFSLFNNAKQINSGIELINFMQSQKKVNLPIIVDNAEAVNELEKTNSQTIELNVSTNKEMEIIYG